MRFKFIFTLLALSALSIGSKAQELDIDVKLTAPASTVVEKDLLDDFEKRVQDFFNNTTWTEDEFRSHEKIKGQINITVTNEINSNTFKIDLLVQSSRPIYKSAYTTPLLNYLDRGILVNYTPGQNIWRSEAAYYDEISSILTFYAYMILGLDYDTFSPLGGEEYYLKTREIISTLPNASALSDGWSNRGGGTVARNRFWMQENLLNPRMRAYRQFLYEYHRLGMDEMYNDPDRQRAIIASGISSLQDIIDNYPNSMVLQMLSDAKKNEIVDIFSVADRGQKKKIYDIMVQCDPSSAGKYVKLAR